MAPQLHYLTVQDILWINFQVTDKVQQFNFALLEEATYYQYGYGEGRSLAPQAARFLAGFPKLHPIDAGNEATIFVACLTFLKLNGMSIDLPDGKGAEWFQSVQTKQVDAQTAIKSIAKPSHGHHDAPSIRKTVKDLIGEYPRTLQALAEPA